MAGDRSYGVVVEYGGDTIGGVQDVQIDGVSVEIIDCTEHRTGADELKGWREKIGGLKDGQSVTILANRLHGDVGQDSWRDSAGESGTLIVTMANGDILTVDVIVGAFQLSNPIDGKIPVTMTGTVKNKPVWS